MNTIELKNITKSYTLLKKRSILSKNLFTPQKKERKIALKNITLSIKKGETLGIIGENGSGKSTLLKIIAGVTIPDKGSVKVDGKVCSLIELGAGFHPDLTGQENIYLNATLLGLTKKEIDEKYQDIVKFAGIGRYINQPIRTYSSGMTVRLGFAVAVCLPLDTLMVDEVLTVGDEKFQQKCISKINALRKLGKTIIFVSHNLHLVTNLCTKTVWIEKGIVRFVGETKTAINLYLNNMEKPDLDSKIDKKRWGSGEAKIVNTLILAKNSYKVTKKINLGDKFLITVRVKFYKYMTNPVFGIIIRNSDAKDVFSTNTHTQGIETGDFKKGQVKTIEFDMLDIFPQGTFTVSPAIASYDLRKFYDWRDNYTHFTIGKKSYAKPMPIKHTISIK
jgi:ABC-type polysaccharide/polyol phosphate transport system ATPase subunit